jgi:predicted PurR-regulated permease PerM
MFLLPVFPIVLSCLIGTIIALFAGGILFGILGVFISFPLAIIIVTTYKYYKDDITRNIKKVTNDD